MRSITKCIIGLLCLSWIGSVLWYFTRSYPFLHIGEIALNGLMLGLLVLFFTAIGRRIARIGRIAFASLTEEVCFTCGIGSAVAMFWVIGLAAVGVLSELTVIAGILGFAALAYTDAKILCIQWYHAGKRLFARTSSPLNTFYLFLIGSATLLTFFAAATPPFFYDALVYHLAVPQTYLLKHGFIYLPHQPFSNFPANLGMLFIVGMSFSGGMLAKLLSWLFLPMTALTVYAWAALQWGRRVAVTAAAIAFLMPGMLIVSTLTTIDNGVAFYALLCFSAFLAWRRASQPAWLVLSAVFCGIAVGIKYTALLTTCFPLLVVVGVHELFRKPREFWRSLRRVVMIGLIILGTVSPWMAKNVIYTGNPLYPFFNAVFGSEGVQMVDYAEYKARDHSLFTRGQSWLTLIWQAIKAPWTVSMTTNGAAGKTGAVFLLCLPGLLLLKKVDGPIKYWLGIAACGFWAWVFGLPRTLRYVFPVFPVLSIVIGYMLWQLPVSRRVRQLVLAGMGGLLVYNLTLFLAEEAFILRPWGYLLGNQSTEQFLVEHGVNYYPVVQYINHNTPPDAKILFVGESRSYYCERDSVLYTVIVGIDDEELPLRRMIIASQSTADVIAQLQQQQITHVLFNMAEMQRFTAQYLSRNTYLGLETEKDHTIYRELFSGRSLRPVLSLHNVALFEVPVPQ